MLPEEDGRVDSASYAVAMVVRPIYVRYVLLFFFGIWKHVSAPNSDSYRPTSELQIQNQEAVTTRHDHGRIRNNTFDQLFLICNRLMFFFVGFESFVGVLNAKLVVVSCPNSGFAASFQVFSVVTCLGKQTCKNHTQWNNL